MHNITAVILTKNSAKTIENCINSIADIVDEIFIIDDYSSDNTLDLIKDFSKVKIYTRALNNDFASQRNFGIEKVKTKYVMHIDSDEYVTDALKHSILKCDFKDDVGYLVVRKNLNFYGYAFEKLINRPLICSSETLFQDPIHERIVIHKKHQLVGSLVHDCWIDMKKFADDINRYSDWKAQAWIKQGRQYNIPYLVFRQLGVFTYQFLYRYFMQRRFLFGFKALLFCLYWSSEELLVGLKFIEKTKK